MIDNLSNKELERLIQTVFALRPEDKSLAFFMDLPNDSVPDTEDWADTRKITYEWYSMLSGKNSLGLSEIKLYCYENVLSNNNDLPGRIWDIKNPAQEISINNLQNYGAQVLLSEALGKMDIGIAPTQLSCTAPMKMLAKKHNFRTATMPGFARRMIPTLSLDYEEIAKRVAVIEKKLNDAIGFSLVLKTCNKKYETYFDLRFRTAHASTGLFREPKTAGNLPSGEAYIVPYEGEKKGEASQTRGEIPVQFEDGTVVYKIENNRAMSVEGEGEAYKREKKMLTEESAYGNIAELGIGILSDFGVESCGILYADEKLGLHVAFGRSDHFGGIVSPESFNDPANVAHMDWVYVKSMQPDVDIVEAKYIYENGREESML